MIPSAEQERAIAAAVEWFADSTRREKPFRLFGAAGTGKTSVASTIAKRLGVSTVYAAYTGKAAQVLANKGCNPSSTIHKLIYIFDSEHVDDSGRVRPTFVLNPLALVTVDLVIVDEVSMVGERMGEDLLSFGTPVLVLGDPYQLPPINGGGFFTDGTPDFLLEEIHRQAGGSPVLDAATSARSGEGWPLMKRMSFGSAVSDHDQIIVGTNKMRHSWNGLVRERRGFSGPLPQVGERLICLENNYKLDIRNGQMFEVIESRFMKVNVLSDTGETRWLPFWPQALLGKDGEAEVADMPYRERVSLAFLTWAYAITCHKAQGSEWGRVLVVDEAHVFQQNAERWMYTAITRARDHISIVRPNRFVDFQPKPHPRRRSA